MVFNLKKTFKDPKKTFLLRGLQMVGNRQSSRSCRFVTWTRRISWSNCPHWNIVIWDWVYEASFKRKNRSNHWPFNMKSVKSVLLKLILTSSQKLTEWKKFAPLSTLKCIFLICAKTILHAQIIKRWSEAESLTIFENYVYSN